LDDLTLSVNLREPAGYFLFMLAGAPLLPLPRHVLECPGSRWAEGVGFVGNGAFTLEVGGANDTWVLKRNPFYPGRVQGNAERIELRLRRERTDAVLDSGPEILAGYQADELDMATLPPAEVRRARQHHPDEEVWWPTTAVYYLLLNRHRPPLGDLRVRRALALGLNRSLLLTLIYGEGVEPALGGLLPPTLPCHSPVVGLSFDPEAARRSLAEAGFPEGAGLGTLSVLHAPRQERHDMVRHMGALWGEELGIRIQGVPCGYADLHRRVRKGDFELGILGWIADYPDPDNFLRVLVEGFLRLHPDGEYTGLVQQAARLMDQRQRMELYVRADRRLADQVFILPIVYGQGRAFIKPWVRREPMWYSCDGSWKDTIIDPH
jgi:oligopeptide transport system substrate-binding protein